MKEIVMNRRIPPRKIIKIMMGVEHVKCHKLSREPELILNISDQCQQEGS
jgi:hypothetical protein